MQSGQLAACHSSLKVSLPTLKFLRKDVAKTDLEFQQDGFQAVQREVVFSSFDAMQRRVGKSDLL